MSIRWLGSILFSIFLISACSEVESAPSNASETASEKTVKTNIAQAMNGAEVKEMQFLETSGLFEVMMENGELFYVTADGGHLIAGELYKLNNPGIVSLTAERQKEISRQVLGNIDDSEMITFKAKNEKAEVFAFTDITCGYCRVMHNKIAEYNAQGITVHYLAFPRHGLDHESAKDMVSIWCADDQQAAMTAGKNGLPVELKTCENPVQDQFLLGVQMGVQGTPAVFSLEGKQLGGYVPPTEMATQLGL